MSRLLLVLFILLCAPAAATAQEADTTAADTTAARDTTTAPGPDAMRRAAPEVEGPMLGFEAPRYGRILSDSIPALLPAVELVEILKKEAAAFTYVFATPGWPDGWSMYGFAPHETALGLGGLPLNHLFTGRAAFNLVPLALTEQPRLEVGRFGSPLAVLTRLRPFVSAEPITEGKYWKGGDGLQSIEAVHAQHRRRTLFGNPGFLNVAGGYTGRAADGEYPGSRLRRGRQVLLRLRYEQERWSVDVTNLHNRREIGAHGGVVPDPGDFESIYRRTTARVEDEGAFRRIVRNDLHGIVRARLFGSEPAAASVFWTAESFHYTLPREDTLGVGSDRLGLRGLLPVVRSANHRLDVHVEAWLDRSDPDSGRSARAGAFHAFVTDSLGYGPWNASFHAGVAGYGGALLPVGKAWMSRRTGPLLWTVRLSLSGRRLSPVDKTGFGTMSGFSGGSLARVALGEGVVRYSAGELDVALGGYLSRRRGGIDYFALGADSVKVLAAPSSARVGGYLEAGWRRSSERGLYAVAAPAWTSPLGVNGSPMRTHLDETLPAFYGRARLGARYEIFLGDLDFDLYVEGSFWSDFRSRTLHPQTGLLIVPDSAVHVGPSSMIDVVLEARVRDAKLFLMYENVLSGTQIMTGNLVVPVYPLPARRFRIGVHWPITG